MKTFTILGAPRYFLWVQAPAWDQVPSAWTAPCSTHCGLVRVWWIPSAFKGLKTSLFYLPFWKIFSLDKEYLKSFFNPPSTLKLPLYHVLFSVFCDKKSAAILVAASLLTIYFFPPVALKFFSLSLFFSAIWLCNTSVRFSISPLWILLNLTNVLFKFGKMLPDIYIIFSLTKIKVGSIFLCPFPPSGYNKA